ncbi:MAG: type II toxin-antitoxin system HicA family toxin [Euryarchaeota archaeon]|nr:type II toxin-antitoxin system HicA family toxin [Euryarchaeota archaeon]MDE1836794.1 type II toxin-antitoxin system HicA family toxin [Euryarchaeota archaeon]MDE1881111.1 type II toxin-antitoxin system HicA family toxin [Euryarchaeota archaeon]MDE2044778.1 type II toxin-antitoxin system HicA family toxin [Thermoplasmata archaeon]
MGTNLGNISPREAIRGFQRAGWVFRRQTGSHYIMSKPGVFGLVVIPIHEGPLKRGTLRACLRIAGVSPEEFAELLES